MASARVQHWALTLSAYDYKVQYVPGKQNANADVFGRLPLPVQPKEVPMPEELVLLLENLEISTPISKNGQIMTQCYLKYVSLFIRVGLISQFRAPTFLL